MRVAFSRPANVSRNALLGALAVILLAVAAWRFAGRGDADELAPSDAASAAGFVCGNCGEFFKLTPQQVEQDERNSRTGQGGRSDPSGGAAASAAEPDSSGGRAISFACVKCGQRRATRAEKCPQHGDIIKLFPGPRDPVKCSKCDFRG